MNVTKNNKIKIFIGVVIIMSSSILGSIVYQNYKQNKKQMDLIVIALPPLESSAILWIAQDQRFFNQNGLNVTFHEPSTGFAALNELRNGEVEIAGTSEYPLVGLIFQKERIKTIVCIDTGEIMVLEGRTDKGKKISDLKGKRIGAIPDTIQIFYLGRFLGLNGINIDDVVLINVTSSNDAINAILNGSVDATVVSEPQASLLKDSLGADIVVWQVQSTQPLFALMVSNWDWITTHPDIVVRFLRSLVQAEEYLINNPTAARAIIQQKLALNNSFVQSVWSRNQFSISLSQSMLLAMEDEARWMISNNLTNVTLIPDFLNYIYIDGLQGVKSEAVNIIS